MSNWRRTLNLSDIFRGEQPFPERRDEMVRRIRRLDPGDTDGELQEIADDLAATENGDEWDLPWDAFYDWADANRVWVRTR